MASLGAILFIAAFVGFAPKALIWVHRHRQSQKAFGTTSAAGRLAARAVARSTQASNAAVAGKKQVARTARLPAVRTHVEVQSRSGHVGTLHIEHVNVIVCLANHGFSHRAGASCKRFDNHIHIGDFKPRHHPVAIVGEERRLVEVSGLAGFAALRQPACACTKITNPQRLRMQRNQKDFGTGPSVGTWRK